MIPAIKYTLLAVGLLFVIFGFFTINTSGPKPYTYILIVGGGILVAVALAKMIEFYNNEDNFQQY